MQMVVFYNYHCVFFYIRQSGLVNVKLEMLNKPQDGETRIVQRFKRNYPFCGR